MPSTYDITKARALHNWVLCRPLKPKGHVGGIVLPFDPEAKTVSEGVAEVVQVGPGKLFPNGTVLDHGLKPGDKILYRGFLRFAHQLGEHFGVDAKDIFVVSADDVLATLEGTGGTIGLFDEYEL